MTTTYELYTNENGTPKAVEGKAPAILERVEALETDVKTLDGDIKTLDGDIKTLDGDVGNIQTAIEVLEGGVVKTINGETPDQAGNIDIPVGHNVGEEWVSYTGKLPTGGVPYCGQEVNRSTYSALWQYAQNQGLVKSESEWRSIASAQGGNVPYYSSGNGSTTFRMPCLVGYVRGASSQSEAGAYVSEGLPNIGGNVYVGLDGTGFPSGSTDTITVGDEKSYVRKTAVFSASNYSSVYGNSSHVTPETSVVLFGVYAFGEISNIGSLDASTLATGLVTVEANKLERSDKAEIVGWGMPDYSSGIAYAWGTTFSAPSDGFIYAYVQVNNKTVSINVNGVPVFCVFNNNYADGQGSMFVVSKGDVITFSGTYWNTATVTFYPCKGV